MGFLVCVVSASMGFAQSEASPKKVARAKAPIEYNAFRFGHGWSNEIPYGYFVEMDHIISGTTSIAFGAGSFNQRVNKDILEIVTYKVTYRQYAEVFSKGYWGLGGLISDVQATTDSTTARGTVPAVFAEAGYLITLRPVIIDLAFTAGYSFGAMSASTGTLEGIAYNPNKLTWGFRIAAGYTF